MKIFLRPNLFIRTGMLICSVALVWAVVVAQGPVSNSMASATLGKGSDVANRAVYENASVLTFGLDSIEVLRTSVLGRPLWQYLATILYLGLAFLAAGVLDRVLRFQLNHWVRRTDIRWDEVTVRRLAGPIKLVTFLAILDVGLELFDWPDWIEIWVAKLSYVAIGASLLMAFIKVVDAAIVIWRTKLPADGDRAFNEQLLLLVGKLLKAGGFVIGLFTVFGHLGIDIRAALASVSVMGLALGLAAQDTVANLFGAVAVFIDRPFKIGDRIRVGDVDGVVEDMGIRATRVRSLDGFLITVPNKTVGNTVVTNISSRPTIRTELNFGLTYDTSAARMEVAVQIIDQVFRNDPKTLESNVYFNRFLDSALNVNVVFVCGTTDWKEYCRILQSLNLQIKQRFDAEGLSFAFPTQTTIHQFPTPPEPRSTIPPAPAATL